MYFKKNAATFMKCRRKKCVGVDGVGAVAMGECGVRKEGVWCEKGEGQKNRQYVLGIKFECRVTRNRQQYQKQHLIIWRDVTVTNNSIKRQY